MNTLKSLMPLLCGLAFMSFTVVTLSGCCGQCIEGIGNINENLDNMDSQVDQMIKALADKDRETFDSLTSEDLQKETTPEKFEQICATVDAFGDYESKMRTQFKQNFVNDKTMMIGSYLMVFSKASDVELAVEVEDGKFNSFKFSANPTSLNLKKDDKPSKKPTEKKPTKDDKPAKADDTKKTK